MNNETTIKSAWKLSDEKKYWLIFKNSLQQGFVYRFNFLASFMSEGLALLVLCYLWFSIYRQGGQIGNYFLGGLVVYYIISRFIALILGTQDIGRVTATSIIQGEFSNYLVKPLSFFKRTLFYNLGMVTYNSLFYIAAFVFFLLFQPSKIDPISILLFAVSIAIAYLINFLIYYSIGVSVFFLGYVSGLNYITFGISAFFSGRIVPLDLLPQWLLTISNYLPFRFMVFVPTAIITGKMSLTDSLINISEGVLWLAILYLASVIIYKKGVKAYESYGG